MFATKIGESVSTTGTSDFSLTQTAYGAFRTWRSGFSSGDLVFYTATNDAGTIWETGYGTFTTGATDTITRNVLASSSGGSKINWATTPYRLYSLTAAEALKHMLAPLVNGVANVPAWLPAGAAWIDYALGIAVAWVKNRYITGTRTAAASHAEEGRYYHSLSGSVASIFAASRRAKFEDKGAASYSFTANDVGKVLAFDCTASARTLTMLAASTAGMGHGAYVWVYPYGSTTNGVTFTPGGADTTDLATAPPLRVTRFQWDGTRSTWVADHKTATSTQLFGAPVGLEYSNLKVQVTSDTALTVTADNIVVSDGTTNMALAAVNSSVASGSAGAGGLDTGAMANTTWYNLWAIAKADGTKAVMLSLSATAPTMPSGYTFKARLGAVRTDGSAHLLRTLQYGNRVQYVVGTNPTTARQMISGVSGDPTVPTWTAQSVSSYVPPTASMIHVGLYANNTAGIAAPNNSYGNLSSSSNPPPLAASAPSAVVNTLGWLVLESTNIYYAGNGAATALYCYGWEDNL